jgi:ATP-dependent Clp endopeptidase proteolytic subunit ClpP
MSEENETQKTSPEEKEINLELKKAQASKLKAEAKKIETESEILSNQKKKQAVDIEKVKIELNKQKIILKKEELSLAQNEIEFKLKQIQLEDKLDFVNRKEASDERNFLYRFNDKVSKDTVRHCMETLTEWHRLDPECAIEIIFSSPGGSIIDGFELFDFLQDLRNKGHHLTTGTLGYAASMAGVLLQAGDVRWVGQQAWVMIHRAAFGAWGKTYEIEDEVNFIKRIEERILAIFTSRSSLTKSKIKRNWDRKDWWISADEALNMGLVDEIRAKMPEHSSS